MNLADGDVVQYEAMKRMSVGDYLVKLNYYVGKIEIQKEVHKNGR